MKKLVYQAFALLTAVALAACGRPSTSNFFGLDGVGPPGQDVPGNPVPGKFGGTISLTNWHVLPPTYGDIFFGSPAFPFHQAYFNATDIGGLGGWELLVIATPAPPRLNGQDWRCYMDPITLPALGGTLESLDVGEDLDFDVTHGEPEEVFSFGFDRDDDRDFNNPVTDTLLWLTGNPDYSGDQFIDEQDWVPGGGEVTVEWDGGTLDNKGFEVAPSFDLDNDDALIFPTEPTGPTGTGLPTVNGVAMGAAPIAEDDEYRVEWAPAVGNDDHLLGMEIIVTVYGPSNLGTEPGFDFVPDNPYFNRLAHMVCLVDDDEGEFVLFQDEVDVDSNDPHAPFSIQELVAMAKDTGKYSVSTEDVNGNDSLDVIVNGCGQPTAPADCVEDGNANNVIDRIYGISLTVNRRAETSFLAPKGGGKDTKILMVGNHLKTGKLEAFSAPAQCNNALDDDGDGLDDEDDPGCNPGTVYDPWDNSELTQCQNGQDDDADNFTDYDATPGEGDPQCADEHDDNEAG